MILTVSPNVALDRVHVVRGYQAGQQSRAVTSFLQPGGSGVHASIVIQALGGESVILGLIGGRTGELWKAEARRRGLVHDMVEIAAETRESFCLIDIDRGNVVESVEEGPRVEPDKLQALLAHLDRYLPQAEMLVLSGSIPPGLPSESYTLMLQLAHRHHVPTLADLHGEQLSRILDRGPWLIKPSLAEFDELIGYENSDLQQRAVTCQALYRNSGVVIALSMAGDGLLVTGQDGQWWLKPPPVDICLPEGQGKNTIGCGDALVGALAYEYCNTHDLLAAAKLGVSAAHFNLGTFGVPEIDGKATRQLTKSLEPQIL